MVTYGSVCSGIEASSMAWEPLGMRPVWFSEIEPFPCSVLAHHWPNVPNIGDMTTLPTLIRTGIAPAPEVLVGGTPCQAFSVAGMRRGLDDERGQLTMTYVEVLNAIDERRGGGDEAVCVWENVPGVLSSKDNAFGCFLAALCGEDEELKPPGKRWANAGCVFGPQRAIAWRVLDAQYFGVAQRRRRVFVVASARAGFDPTSVLFESEGVRRDTPPSREAGAIVAALTAQGVGTCGADDNQAQAGHLLAQPFELANTLTARSHKGINSNVTERQTPVVCFDSRQDPNVYGNLAGPCSASVPVNAVASFKPGQGAAAGSLGYQKEISPTLTATDSGTQRAPGLLSEGTVRRLTPVECERLQGFPDGHTDVPHRGKPAADGPRYKAIGNSKAVPVVNWLGKRILKCLINF